MHQKVFPHHHVIGWYRVVNEQSANCPSDKDYVLPSEEDLKTHSGWMKEFNPNPIFLLMNASQRKDRDVKSVNQSQDGDDDAKIAINRLEREEELPLSIYDSIITENGGLVFINLDFDVETFEPERIAVEKVLQSQKPDLLYINRQGKEKSVEISEKKESGESDIEMSTVDAEEQTFDRPPTATESHLQSVTASIDAMNTRITILLDFLEKTHSKQIPINHDLLRQVNSLVKQIPFVMAYKTAKYSDDSDDNDIGGGVFDKDSSTTLAMSYLASITKTTNAVIQYSKKVATLLKK